MPKTPPGLTQSFLDICKQALLDLGVLSSGENPTADEANDCLIRGNQMIDSWQIDGGMIFTSNILTFPFQPGKQDYTMGTGGEFDTPRPNRINEASVILDTNGIEIPIRYTRAESEWQEIIAKNVSSTYPWVCYDTDDYPFRHLKFYPVPAGSSFRCYSWAPLTQFTDLKTPHTFPPGYAEAIAANLAIRVAPMFKANVSAVTALLAQSGLDRIKSSNLDVPKLKCDEYDTYGDSIGYTGSNIPFVP